MPFIPDNQKKSVEGTASTSTKKTGFVPDKNQGILSRASEKPEQGFLRSLFNATIKPVAQLPIQLPKALISGIAGLTGADGAIADWANRSSNVPILGEVKPLSAVPGDVEKYGAQTPQETFAQATDIASMLIGGGAVKAGLKGKVLVGATQGAKSGALAGASSSLKEEDDTAGDMLASIAGGAVAGGVLGGALPILARGATKVIGGVKTQIKAIKSGAAREALAGLDTHTLNVLDPTKAVPEEALSKLTAEGKKVVSPKTQETISTSYNTYLKQAKRAASNSALETPLELAGKKGETALETIGKRMSKQGKIKQEALGKVGNMSIDTRRAKETLVTGLREVVGADIVPVLDDAGAVTGYAVQNAEGRVSRIALDPSDKKLVQDVYALLDNLDDTDTVFRADGTVDAIQDILYKRKTMTAVPVNSQTESVLKKAVGELNAGVRKIGGKQYTQANDKFAYMIDLRDKLNKALGQDASKGGSLMKRVFSPTDGGTKQLFKQIKDLTGIDLVREATLAKQAMEIAGDTRQRNLLQSLQLLRESIPTSPSGVIDKAVTAGARFVQEKVADKGEVIQSVLERAAKKASQ